MAVENRKFRACAQVEGADFIIIAPHYVEVGSFDNRQFGQLAAVYFDLGQLFAGDCDFGAGAFGFVHAEILRFVNSGYLAVVRIGLDT